MRLIYQHVIGRAEADTPQQSLGRPNLAAVAAAVQDASTLMSRVSKVRVEARRRSSSEHKNRLGRESF